MEECGSKQEKKDEKIQLRNKNDAKKVTAKES